MKTEMRNQKPVFIPVELVIRIESEEDLALLWAVFNAPSTVIRAQAKGTWAQYRVDDALVKIGESVLGVWTALEDERQRRGL